MILHGIAAYDDVINAGVWSMSDIVHRRFTVSGRVQGVYFRASTRQVAQQLSLRGYARNLSNGNVEVLAIGDRASVDALAKWLWTGSPAARVDHVQSEEAIDVESFETFPHFEAR